MDELKTIEAYTRELEALRNYDRIKKERDELAERCSKLETRVSELKGELASLKGFNVRFVGKELTLGQAKVEFVRAYNDEIERRANQKFGMLKADLEARMPGLIYDKLIETLGKPPWPKEIAGAIEARAREIAGGILADRESWPKWFDEYFLKEVRAGVGAGLNSEFERRVEKTSGERAEVKLRELAQVEWPRWYEVNVKPKLSILEAKIKQNAIGMLRGPWRGITCDKCGTEHGEIELPEQGISTLLSQGHIELECVNPDCREWDRIRRHKIRIFLYDLIAAHIGR